MVSGIQMVTVQQERYERSYKIRGEGEDDSLVKAAVGEWGGTSEEARQWLTAELILEEHQEFSEPGGKVLETQGTMHAEDAVDGGCGESGCFEGF